MNYTQQFNQSLQTPITRLSNGSWINRISRKIFLEEDIMWETGQPNGADLQECLISRGNPLRYLDDNCIAEYPFICSWTKKPEFMMKGLCKNSKIDVRYILMHKNNLNPQIGLFGYGKNFIYQSTISKVWYIGELNGKHIKENFGYFVPDLDSNQMPFGLKKWNLSDPACSGIRELTLSKVYTFF